MLSSLKKLNLLSMSKSIYNVGLLQGSMSYRKIDLYGLERSQCNTLQKGLHTSPTILGLKSKGRSKTLMNIKKNADELKEKGLWIEDRRSDFIEWNYDAEIYSLGKRINEEFDDELIREAFVNSSYVHQEEIKFKNIGTENIFELKSNDDLAIAGRALMQNYLPKYLRVTWSSLPEEGIQATTDYLLTEETLSHIGRGLGLKELLLTAEYPPLPISFAKSFCALVSVLNISSGQQKTYKFIEDFVVSQLVGKDLWDVWNVDDPYTMLSNIFKRNDQGELEPRIVGDIGKNTIESVYHIGIYSNKQFIGAGYGDTIDVGVKVACYNCLSKMFGQSLDRNSLPFNNRSNIQLQEDPNILLNEFRLKNVSK